MDLFKSFLAGPFDHPVQLRILLVQLHVDIVPKPHPAAPFFRRFPPWAVKYALMVAVKMPGVSGDETLFFILHNAFSHQ